MQKELEALNKLNQTMAKALTEMESTLETIEASKTTFNSMAKMFLLGLISIAAEKAEAVSPGNAVYFYTDLEAAIKQGGFNAVAAIQQKNSQTHLSVSNIDPDNESLAINYLSQELNVALFKHINDLPVPLRKPEILLRGVEALLCNLLHHNIGEADPHELLDVFYKNVYLGLDEMIARHIKH